MAEEPKKTRKRAVKKSPSAAKESGANAKEGKEKKGKAGVVPAPIFQAAPVVSSAPKVRSERPEKAEKDSDENDNRRRRRRRGGRGRRRPEREERAEQSVEVSEETKEQSPPSGEVLLKKRRRRRRSGGENITPGETVEEDGVVTVVKVRESRPRPERPVRENKSFDRDRDRGRDRRFRDRDRDRDRGRERHRYSDYRENRRRGTILTDAEFLARRESVDREMLVRQQGDRTQIAILEDNILVEHYVNKNSNISYVGNVYLKSSERSSFHGSCIRRYWKRQKCGSLCRRSELGYRRTCR